jgi:hypothetical protein
VTLVSIEACNLFWRFARTGAAPILAQLTLPRHRPFFDEASGRRGQGALDYFACFNGNERFMLAINRVEMRRRVISNEHADRDA